MKKFIDYFVDNTGIVNLLTILIIVTGGFSVYMLNKETFPNVDFNYVVIRHAYPGAAAEDVSKLVALDVEKALKSVDGIDELNTISGENGLITSVRIDPDENVNDILPDIKDAIDSITGLPDDVEDAVITKISNKNRGLMNVGVWGKSEMDLRPIVKRLQRKLEFDNNISSVELSGYRDERYEVKVSPKLLEEFDISLIEIVSAIKDRQTNVSAGSTKNIEEEKLIRTVNELKTLDDVKNIILRSSDAGDIIRVSDVATVEYSLKDWTIKSRAQRNDAFFLDIKAKSKADVLRTAKAVKKIFKEAKEEYKIEYKIYDDLSYYVSKRLGILTQNGIQGIILVTICLYLFMNLKVSVITALGAPFAFLVAFSFMDSLGITINLISMFGLILVLGMLVDDSIIVSEQYYQNLEDGLPPKDAAKKAAMQTIGPVTATVLTTMVAFGSLFFMEGRMGKFLWPVPAVVIISLAASWLECFIILPGHLADWAPKFKKPTKDPWYKKWMARYESILRKLLKRSWTTIFFFIAVFVVSAYMAVNMRFELFPSKDVVVTAINIKGAVGISLEKTEKELIKIENIIKQKVKEEELTGVRSISGFQFFLGGRSKRGSHYGSVFVELVMSDLRDRSTDEILSGITDELKKKVSEFEFSINKFTGGPPKGEAIKVVLLSEEIEDLKKVAKEAKKKILEMDEVSSLELDYEDGKEQIVVRINANEARRLGVSNEAIALEIRNAYEGVTATTIKKSDDDIDVIVRLDEVSRSNEDVLKNLRITNNAGLRVKLSAIATFDKAPGAYIIRRKDRQIAFALIGDVDLTKSTSRKVNKKITPIVTEIVKKYPSVTYRLDGENKDTNQALTSALKAFIVSMLIIFMMLYVQFSSGAQPVIIMTAIPFSLIGVVLSFWIMDLSIGFMALMGILGLVGVVVNDSIVLVTFINRALKEQMSFDSIIKATVSRFRPVILTTVTTVVGLLPVAHMPGGDPFLKPMATSFAYGLLFSSLITLVFVPACYKVYLDFVNRKNANRI
ncbi:MAG: efflux RND transporter permease subunit [Bacteriovoracaceae bacterium]|jgi:multidrug efflux pump subunit AcrB|nr:efflux RND transporter permease subunit [Bacteriovoracaceae bacterium]